ncbi:MAG: anti-sigma factor family protein [Armatimonadota bacterium]
MNCRKVQNLISAYIDSELTGMEMLAIRDHVNHCANCNQEYKSLLRLKRCFGRMQSKQPADHLSVKICSVISYESNKKSRKPFALPRLHLNFFTTKFRYAAVGAGILSMLILISSGMITTSSHKNSSEYHMELSSLINDNNILTGYHEDQSPSSSTNDIRINRKFNMPWGLSNKAESSPLLSHNTQMVLASY